MSQKKIEPKCLNTKQNAFGHSAKGFILPCCWCDTTSPEKDKNLMNLMKEKLKLENNDCIEDIIFSDEWNYFLESITSKNENAPKVCHKYCAPQQKNITKRFT